MIDNEVYRCRDMLLKAKRPIFLVGHGLELAQAKDIFKAFLEKYPIPVVWSQGGINVLPSGHPLNIGKIGIKGSRSGNFTVQNSDFVLVIGSRLSVSTTGQEYDLFAREAKIVVVDVDYHEHKKNTVRIDLYIQLDAQIFLTWLSRLELWAEKNPFKEWVEKCQHWKKIFAVYRPEYANSEKVNLYYFIEELSKQLRKDDVVVADAGSAMFVTSQALRFGENNRVILSHAQAEMGFTIPACVGVACAKKSDVIGICGDGSFQMNVQELQTIRHNNLPIKLFVWNNEGYATIRTTHKNFFGRVTGADKDSEMSLPDISKIAYAYDIPYIEIPRSVSAPHIIEYVLKHEGPIICEVKCLKEQDILTVKSKYVDGRLVSSGLEDMYPYLPRDVFYKEMIVKPIGEENNA